MKNYMLKAEEEVALLTNLVHEGGKNETRYNCFQYVTIIF